MGFFSRFKNGTHYIRTMVGGYIDVLLALFNLVTGLIVGSNLYLVCAFYYFAFAAMKMVTLWNRPMKKVSPSVVLWDGLILFFLGAILFLACLFIVRDGDRKNYSLFVMIGLIIFTVYKVYRAIQRFNIARKDPSLRMKTLMSVNLAEVDFSIFFLFVSVMAYALSDEAYVKFRWVIYLVCGICVAFAVGLGIYVLVEREKQAKNGPSSK